MSYGFGKLNEYAERIYANAKAKGFHEYAPEFGKAGQDTRHILSWLMLVTTEVAEAAEAVRKGDKDNFSEELADICIRVFDCAEALGLNIEQEIVNKMERNEERPHKHGGKLA
jgi:NTP pyrophosphatase (non-canonical NTP hydrolase)